MTTPTPERREQWRKWLAEGSWPNDGTHVGDALIVALDALDAAEAERGQMEARWQVAARTVHKRNTAEARLARLDDPALRERVAEALHSQDPEDPHAGTNAQRDADTALAVVRDHLYEEK